MAGEKPTIADCTLLAGLRFGASGGYELDDRYEALGAWLERFGARPSVQQI